MMMHRNVTTFVTASFLALASMALAQDAHLVTPQAPQLILLAAAPVFAGSYDEDEVLEAMCQAYSSAVNASDSATYASLFTEDAIRVPPGANPEYGREQIQRGEQADYDVAQWSVTFTPRDALPINEDWMYGIADVEVEMVAHADGATSNFRLTVAWLLQRQPSGEWLIKRQMWNRKPDQAS